MIYLGILKISGEYDKIPDAYLNKFTDEVKSRINNTKNPDSRTARIGAYSLLAAMYDGLKGRGGFPEKMPEIFYTGEGKPVFCDNNSLQNAPRFNISHDGGFCVCAMCADGDVGVDIQSEPRRSINLGGVAERFFAPLRAIDKRIFCDVSRSADCEITAYEMRGCEVVPAEDFSVSGVPLPQIFSDSGFLPKWTLLEALLKMSGGGFREVCSAGELFNKARIASFKFIFDGKEYCICAARSTDT